MNKTCTICGELKDVNLFAKVKNGLHGVRGNCKSCAAKKEKQRYNVLSTLKKVEIAQKRAARDKINRITLNTTRSVWLEKNPGKEAFYSRQAYRKNKEVIYARKLKWARSNKTIVAAISRRWRENNPDKVTAAVASRSAAKRSALADWDIELTSFVTGEAARLCKLRAAIIGGLWHIDHVVPLRGKIVSGLHVWNNLQVLPAAVNIRKSNKFIEG